MEKMISIPKEEYVELKQRADMDDELLIQLIRGLEDIKAGRIKEWNPKS